MFFRLTFSILWLVALLLPATLLFRPSSELAHFPLSEDGYYALTVARNLALGNGLSIDGIQPTNGFQPLFTVFCSLAYWITGGEKLESLRIILVIHYVLFTISAFLFARLVNHFSNNQHTALSKLLPMSLFLSSVPLYLNYFSGLETGLAIFLFLAICNYLMAYFQNITVVTSLVLGVLLGFFVLARIDGVFFVGSIAFCLLFARNLKNPARLLHSVLVCSTAFVVSLPWWAYNVAISGSAIPSSGVEQIEFRLSGGRLMLAVSSAAHNFLNILHPKYLFSIPEAFTTLLYASAIMLAFGLTCLPSQQNKARNAAYPTAFFCTTLFLLSLLGSYILFSRAIHYYPRYLILFSVVGLGILSYIGLCAKHYKRSALLILAFGVGLSLYQTYDNNRYIARNFYFNHIELIDEHVPSGHRVGAVQSGTVGYFLENIVNLDGKVNKDALEHRKNNTLDLYLKEANINWICDWENGLRHILKSSFETDWKIVARKETTVLLQRRVLP